MSWKPGCGKVGSMACDSISLRWRRWDWFSGEGVADALLNWKMDGKVTYWHLVYRTWT